MSPLPNVDSELENRLDGDPSFMSAYDTCLNHEQQLASLPIQARHIRILGFLLLHAPNHNVRREVSKSIHRCKDQADVLVELGRFFEIYVILPFKKSKGRTPSASSRSSMKSFSKHWKEMKETISEVPRNHMTAKKYALIRDRWSCHISGVFDRTIPSDIWNQRDPKGHGVYTECAHIIPEAIFFKVKDKSGTDPKLDYSACILAILQMFRYDISSLNGEKVHSLTNVITMEHNVHDLFDRMDLCLEATSTENRYQVKQFVEYELPVREFVTFSTDDPKNLPVPSPELLALHAACCKVAHMSGATEYIDRTYDDAEEMGVLAFDGSSGDILHYKLLSSVAHAPPTVHG